MDWNKGYKVRYYVTIVDPKSWKDISRFDITSGSINHSTSGLRESADVTCRNFSFNGEKWVRIYVETSQSGNSYHGALFTGLAVSPESSWNGDIVDRPFQCYSVLKPADDVLLQRGWFAPAGVNSAVIIKELLSVVPAPVVIEGDAPSLTNYIIAENNESMLSMIDKILVAINWRIRILGDGTIVLCSKPNEPSITFDSLNNDSIEPVVSVKSDWFYCPNVLRAVSGNVTSIAKDNSESSPLSIPNIGREVWAEESASKLNTGEDIGTYAIRRLRELQRVGISVDYTRRFVPDLLVGDFVRLHYPKQEIDGVYCIASQKIELTHNGRTTEEVNLVT